ncbi:MAG: 50S ribosomal protein L3 [Candidatus Margulisiibacteriota bacterium]|nr:50S ribosomal protein L3 [Candidatus Margulisiibacteriota bacterium]
MLAKKLGMTQIFDEAGNVVPVTVLEAGPCVVTQVKTNENVGYSAIQVGFGKAKKLNKPMKGHLKEASSAHLKEFRVAKTGDYKVGQEIKAEVFKKGDVVTVSGTTIGKGFAGTIKRHNFSRGPMSHGSKNHRLPGSIGGGTTPGRVFKGLKMAGRMGNEKVTQTNVKVAKVDGEKNLILLKGAVPGKPGNLLVLSMLKAVPRQSSGQAPEPAKEEKK